MLTLAAPFCQASAGSPATIADDAPRSFLALECSGATRKSGSALINRSVRPIDFAGPEYEANIIRISLSTRIASLKPTRYSYAREGGAQVPCADLNRITNLC